MWWKCTKGAQKLIFWRLSERDEALTPVLRSGVVLTVLERSKKERKRGLVTRQITRSRREKGQ